MCKSSGCFWNCGVYEIEPGSGGKCWVRFNVFHSVEGPGCCPHAAPDDLEFGYRYHDTPPWSVDTAYKGAYVYNEDIKCWGYEYLSPWLELDDDTSYDFYFECEDGCYCDGDTDVDC